MESALLNVTEAAKYLGVHPDTIRSLTKRGELRETRVAYRVLYRKDVLHEYIEKNTAQERA